MPEFVLPNPQKPVPLNNGAFHSESELVGAIGAHLSSGRCPVRVEPRDGSECDTRLTFGMFFEITGIQPAANPEINPTAAWLKIRILNSYATMKEEAGNCGWIESHRATLLDKDWAIETLKKRRFRLFSDRDFSKLAVSNGNFYQGIGLTVNSRLPGYKSGKFEFRTAAGPVTFEALKLPAYSRSSLASDIGSAAANHKLRKLIWEKLGSPYVWGWDDCSAFVQDVAAALKVSLPRNSSAQRTVAPVTQIPEGSRAFDIIEKAPEGALLGYKGHIGFILQTKNGPMLAHHKQRVRIDPLDEITGQTPTVVGKNRATEVALGTGI